MKFNIESNGFKVTQAISNYAQDRAEASLLKVLAPAGATCLIKLKNLSGPHGRPTWACEMVARFPKKHRIHVDERAQDIYKAIDLAANRLGRSVKRTRQKIRTKERKEGKSFRKIKSPEDS